MRILSFAPAYVVQLITSLLGIFVITRILTPQEYGLYALALSLMSLCQSALFSWSDVGIKRFLERAVVRGQVAVLAATVYSGLGVGAVVLVVLGCAGLAFSPNTPGIATLLVIGSAAVIARQFSQVAKSFQLAALARNRFLLMDCSENVISLAAGLALCWYAGMGAAGIMLGMLAGALVVVAYDVRSFLGRLRGGLIDLRLQREVIGFAAPIAAVFFAEYIVASADRWLIEYFLGSHALGIYAVAYNVADRAVSAVFVALAVASYPLVMQAFERDGAHAARMQALRYAELLMALSLPAIGGFIVVSQRLAAIFTGPAYAAEVAPLMPLIGLAIFINGVRTHYVAQSMHLARRTWLILASSVPAALVNLLANVVLLPRMGLMGAVWATVIAYALGLVVNVVLMATTFPLPFPVRESAKALAGTLIMCAVLQAVPFPRSAIGLVAMMLAGGACYGTAAFGFDLIGVRTRAIALLARRRPAMWG